MRAGHRGRRAQRHGAARGVRSDVAGRAHRTGLYGQARVGFDLRVDPPERVAALIGAKASNRAQANPDESNEHRHSVRHSWGVNASTWKLTDRMREQSVSALLRR